jgi:hypothetical protein
MRSRNTRDRVAPQQIKEGPAREAWFGGEVKFEIARLRDVLRDRLATDEERAIAQSQISNYKEMAANPPASWLRQMSLLADLYEEHCSMSDEHSLVADEGSLVWAAEE